MSFRSSRASLLVARSCTTTSLSQPPRVCHECLSTDRKILSYTNPKSLHTSSKRHNASWVQAAKLATNLLSKSSVAGPNGQVSVDPLRIVAKEMKFLSGNIRELLGSGHPSLDKVAKYYTQAEGKHFRPLLVLLMSRATSNTPKSAEALASRSTTDINESITRLDVLSDDNPSASAQSSYPASESDILPSQRRLAEITELIHTASLLHDDVIDHSDARRGAPSANIEFGNKMAVLAGDFLLGRASVALARLRDAEVTELLATVIANLVEGEFMQLKNTSRDEKNPVWTEDTVSYYLQKTYLKTASLISKSCRAAALLGGNDNVTVERAYAYGKNLGLAFQLVDDMLDYTITEAELGKPAGADLELGLATAPLLFAWKHNPGLGALVGRKFCEEGDVAKARLLVSQSDGIEQTRALAREYAEKALEAIAPFPESEAKEGLKEMVAKTLNRRK